MAIPILTKTWQFDVNQSVTAQGSALATMRRVMRTIVDSLVGFATLPWVVRGSSDSVAAAMDSTNRWLADANLVWSGGTHSWIVLRQTGVSATFEICIDLSSGSAGIITVAFSSTGFTGGTTSARPTAADEVVSLSANQWCTGTDVAHVVHAMQSTDGKATRVAVCAQSTTLATFFLFDSPLDPVTNWADPVVVHTKGIGSGFVITLATMNTSTTAWGYQTVAMPLYFTRGGFAGYSMASTSSIGGVGNEISGEWDLPGMGVACSTAGKRGRHGGLADIWWKPEGIGHGDTGPNDVTRQFVAMGGVFLPWDGSVVVLA